MVLTNTRSKFSLNLQSPKSKQVNTSTISPHFPIKFTKHIPKTQTRAEEIKNKKNQETYLSSGLKRLKE